MKTFMLFELLIALEFLPGVLGIIMGFKSLWFLPFIIVLWIVHFQAFNRSLKEKARRMMRADGPSKNNTYVENIIQQNGTACQDKSSRRKERKREVFIYE